MNEATVNSLSIGVGLVLAVAYLIGCWLRGHRPVLTSAVLCVLSGAGFVAGVLLVYGGFDAKAVQVVLRPEHYVIAGLAVFWVSTQGAKQILDSIATPRQSTKSIDDKGGGPDAPGGDSEASRSGHGSGTPRP